MDKKHKGPEFGISTAVWNVNLSSGKTVVRVGRDKPNVVDGTRRYYIQSVFSGLMLHRDLMLTQARRLLRDNPNWELTEDSTADVQKKTK